MVLVQLTTVHNWDDIRIYHKISRSLAAAGYEVSFVAPADTDFVVDGVSVKALPPITSRLSRIWRRQPAAWKLIRKINPAIVHFHDPELIPMGLLLKCFGYKVIYDSHEDVPRQIMAKHWIPIPLRYGTAALMKVLNFCANYCFDAIFTATQSIAENCFSKNTSVLFNYPLLAEFSKSVSQTNILKKPTAIYVGGLTPERGIGELVDAIAMCKNPDAKLILAGKFSTPEFEHQLRAKPGWKRTVFLGWLSREQIAAELTGTSVGMLTLHSTPNHIESVPIKLFEYMAAGIPVIASDFPFWRTLAGPDAVFVDPENLDTISKAIDAALAEPVESAARGKRGQVRVHQEFNWENEAKKLIQVYERVVSK